MKENAARQATKERDLKRIAQRDKEAHAALEELRAHGSLKDRVLATMMLEESQAAKQQQAAAKKLRICDVRRAFFEKVFEQS
jgi:hypothetical protein